jgi:hypothetical protein
MQPKDKGMAGAARTNANGLVCRNGMKREQKKKKKGIRSVLPLLSSPLVSSRLDVCFGLPAAWIHGRTLALGDFSNSHLERR